MAGALSAVIRAPSAALRAMPATATTSSSSSSISPTRLCSAVRSLLTRLNLFRRFGLSFSISTPSARLLLLGLFATHGRTIWAALQTYLQQRFVLSVLSIQTDRRNEVWDWLEMLWQHHEIGKDGCNFAVAPLKEGEEELIASGAEVPLRTTLQQDGSTWFMFSPKTCEIYSTWRDLLRVPASYRSPLALPRALHPLELACLRLLPFTPHSATLGWLSFDTETVVGRTITEVLVSTLSLTRSRLPLEALVRKARAEYMQDQIGLTNVFMPDSARDGWERALSRPRRSVENVVLEERKKRALFDDARAFVDPANRTWMAQRGLPYRRGYMLGDSVGALAAPPPPPPAVRGAPTSKGAGSGAEGGSGSGGAAGAGAGGAGQLSFSSLLQVLDGAGSSENRLLIMTTNHPERLDPALIRPGRIDVKVCFENASRTQARDLFVRIFSDSDDVPSAGHSHSHGDSEARAAAAAAAAAKERARDEAIDRARFGGGSSSSSSSAHDAIWRPRTMIPSASSSSSLHLIHGRPPSVTRDELERLAERFAGEVPDDQTFSMAELQGFLIRQALRADRFGDLGRAAVETVGLFPRWRDGQLRRRRKRARAVAKVEGKELPGEEGEEEEEDNDLLDEKGVCDL